MMSVGKSGLLIPVLLFITVANLMGAEQSAVEYPFRNGDEFVVVGKIDEMLMNSLAIKGIQPANLCSDEVFIRRVFLDMTGTLPESWETTAFLKSQNSNKRRILINRLMEREAFVDFWTFKWCDLLRVKAEYPINLWPNGVQAYARWIHEAVKYNMPYDQFARELLTSSGSNFRVPPVNFYRAIQGEEPSAIAAAVALTFMGTRIEKWPEEKRAQLENVFSRVAFKHTAEWKEVIVHVDPDRTKPLQAILPDGKTVTVRPESDPRVAFADWLITPDNDWFSRNICNRIWSWFMGRGIIHEPDDIRPDNLAVYPEILTFLQEELYKSKYDLRHIFRLILTSSAYQQSCIPSSQDPQAETLFAHYPVRRLDAEVLVDAICWLTGTQEEYSSVIPEPFTFIPATQSTVKLVDGSITSPFLKMFGRPERDTGLEAERSNEVSDGQRLHLLNSTHIKSKIERGLRLKQLFAQNRGKTDQMIRQIYLLTLSRNPTKDEMQVAAELFNVKARRKNRQAAIDLIWALINSKEFLYRH